MRLIFADNALGQTEAAPENSGWQTMHEGENAPGSAGATGDGQAAKKGETKPIVVEPIRRKKKRRGNPQAGTNLGIHRNQGRQNYTGDPATYNQPYTNFKDIALHLEDGTAPNDAGVNGARRVSYEELAEKLTDPEKRKAYADSKSEEQRARWMVNHYKNLLKLLDTNPYHKDLVELLRYSTPPYDSARQSFNESIAEHQAKLDAAAKTVRDIEKEFGLGQRSEEQNTALATAEAAVEEALINEVRSQPLSIASLGAYLRQAGVGSPWFRALGIRDPDYAKARVNEQVKRVMEKLRREGRVERALGVGRNGNEALTYNAVKASRLVYADLYQDDEANQKGTGFDAPQGGAAYQGDTNYTPGPQGNPARPVNFSDRRRRLDYKKGGYGKTGLPEPPPMPGVDYANGAVEWPIGSESEEMGMAAGLVFAAEDPTPEQVWLDSMSKEDRAKADKLKADHPDRYAAILKEYLDEAPAKPKGPKLTMPKKPEPPKPKAPAEAKAPKPDAPPKPAPAGIPSTLQGPWVWTEPVLQETQPVEEKGKAKSFAFQVSGTPKALEDSAENVDVLFFFTLTDNGTVWKPSIEKVQFEDPAVAKEVYGVGYTKANGADFLRWIPSQGMNTVFKQAGEALKKAEPTSEKTEDEKGRYYNVLKDPVLTKLAPGITDEERLFTNLRNWSEDVFYADPRRLDSVAQSLLNNKKHGKGKYFSWDMTTEEDIAQEQKKRTDQGLAVSNVDPVLFIKRTPAWTNIQDAVAKARGGGRRRRYDYEDEQ